MGVWKSNEKTAHLCILKSLKIILFEKHLEVAQKYSAARRIFNSFLGVSSDDETRCLMLDILRKNTRFSFGIGNLVQR